MQLVIVYELFFFLRFDSGFIFFKYITAQIPNMQ